MSNFSNLPLDRETTIKIFKNGTYYNPASSHYNTDTSVICDRCKRTNLDMCIGYDTYDLCLQCIQDISLQLKKQPVSPQKSFPEIATYMQQSQFQPQMMTNMEQGQFRTRMLQRQFRNNDSNYEVDDTKTFMLQSQFRH